MPFVWAGYILSGIAKPLVAIAPAWGWVLGARVIDRAGKGVRTAPRDALLRDSSDPSRSGAVFGFHRFMDSAGATFGPLIALALLAAGLTLRQVIAFAVVPAVLTLFVLRFVHEAPHQPETPVERSQPRGSMELLPRPFWRFTIAWTIFCAGNSADVFLLLRAHELGLNRTATVAAYALYNVVYAGLSYPLGHLSDRVGKRRVLACGMVVFAAVYAGFGLASSSAVVWPLMAVYGGYIAATDGVSIATVAASLVAGVLWQEVSPGAVFALGAGAALLGLVALAVLRPPAPEPLPA
jgi:MFS family permease